MASAGIQRTCNYLLRIDLYHIFLPYFSLPYFLAVLSPVNICEHRGYSSSRIIRNVDSNNILYMKSRVIAPLWEKWTETEEANSSERAVEMGVKILRREIMTGSRTGELI